MTEISFGKIIPRDYQLEAYNACCENIRHYQGAFFVEASVGAGKTIIMGCILGRAQKNGLRALVLARQGELVEQNSETFWAMDVKNSIFSASLNIKSQHYPIIIGTEGTIARALPAEMKEASFDLLIIDECLTGGTMISTKNGIKKIKDISEKDEVFCINEETGELLIDSPVRVFSNGTRSVSSIKHNHGEIICTSTHRLLSRNSWIRAESLNRGDWLTLNGSRDFVMKKLLRALAAVTKSLFCALKKNMVERQ